MDKPTLTINGKVIEMPAVKARIWREVMALTAERKNISTVDFVERHCDVIAMAFNITKDDVLDNISVEDVLPTFNTILVYISSLITAKLGDTKKNVDVDVQV